MLKIYPVNYPANSEVIKAIRHQVFEVEQNVDPALEFDGKDEAAHHLLAYLNSEPVGTLRIRYLDPHQAKIERLAVLASARGLGIGQQLMEKALEFIALTSVQKVTVNAQEYITKLYLNLGFEIVGKPFDEAGIPHIKMEKIIKPINLNTPPQN